MRISRAIVESWRSQECGNREIVGRELVLELQFCASGDLREKRFCEIMAANRYAQGGQVGGIVPVGPYR